MSDKPPVPARTMDPFPRIDIDEDGPFRHVLRLGVSAADRWMLGPDGPYNRPALTLSDVTRAAVREALLHLLELGFIDIDEERLSAAKGWPLHRDRSAEPFQRQIPADQSGETP